MRGRGGDRAAGWLGFVLLGDKHAPTRPLARGSSSAARPAPDATERKPTCGARRSTALAMQHATDETVLGDFNDASFDHAGVRSRFFRKDGKFLVETDGPDGKLAVFEVKYTFGVDPLQQYLVEFPDGRMQALSIAWDSRPSRQGGQRWFHLYPNETIRHDDILHWTKLEPELELHVRGVPLDRRAQELRRGRATASPPPGRRSASAARRVTARARATSPGRASSRAGGRSARATIRTWAAGALRRAARRRPGRPMRRPATRRAAAHRRRCAPRSRPAGCATRRRGQLSEAWVPGRSLSDTHMVSPLARGLYHADGQMLDEVYNYGSFKQSRMFAAGVTCSDCHDPHSAKLRAAGDGVCLQCHAPAKYAAASHHRHEGADPADLRVVPHADAHLHGRRPAARSQLPRPAPRSVAEARHAQRLQRLSRGQAAAWAAAAIERWFGPDRKGLQTYARSVPCGMERRRGCGQAARRDRGGSQRAGDRARERADRARRRTSRPPTWTWRARASPIPIRWCASARSTCWKARRRAQLWPLVSPLLSDPVRGVRIRAASLLAGGSDGRAAGRGSRTVRARRGRVRRRATLNADRPEARTTLGSFLARQGRADEAEAEYQAALRLSPTLCAGSGESGRPATGNSGATPTAKRSCVRRSTHRRADAGLHHALGLTLIRLKQHDAALAELRQSQAGRASYQKARAACLEGRGYTVK